MRSVTARIALAFAIVYFCALPAPIPAQNVLRSDWADVMSAVRPVVDAEMEAAKVTGMMIALVDGDELVWSEGFGHADLAAGRRADADTAFEIGSVSKTFTGLMVMKLAEEGKLDIDRPLADYIPSFRLAPPVRDFPRSDRPITVRDMMAHHSGIPGDLLAGVFGTAYDPGFSGKLLEWLAKDSATYPPGYRLSYSNTAVALLKEVIETASGQSFKEYSDAFLTSMGMAPASYFKDDPALLERLSRPYSDGAALPDTFINVPASGSIAASANQMALYLRMLLGSGSVEGRRIVKPETLSAMLEKQYPDSGLDLGTDMGLSFFLSDPALGWAGSLFWHNGETLAFRSHMEILADQGLAVFVAANSTGGGEAAANVARAALTATLEAKRGQVPPEPPKALSLSRIALPARLLESIAGYFVYDDLGTFVRLRPQDGGLARTTISSEGVREDPPLYLWSDGLFRTRADAAGSAEFREVAGRYLMIFSAGEATWIGGERYTPRSPEPPAAWKARIGDWKPLDRNPADFLASGEASALGFALPSLRLGVSGGLLTMTLGGSLYVLEPVSDTVAAVRGLGRFGGTSVRIEIEGGRERLRFLMRTYGK